MNMTTNEIAIQLKKVMLSKKITAYRLIILTKLSKSVIYSILKMGDFQNKNYTINSLLKVAEVLNLKITLNN